MRRHALLALAFGLGMTSVPAWAGIGTLSVPGAPQPIVKVGYYCSPGFVASYGRCVATASTDEIDLSLNEPGGYDQAEAPPPAPRVLHRHRRRALHERY